MQEMIQNRLAKNLRARKSWLLKEKIEAYRLYDRDIPEYPFIVDVYKEHIIIYDRGDRVIDVDPKKKDHPQFLEKALQQIFPSSKWKIIWKERERQRGTNQYEKLAERGEFYQVREGPALFYVNLYDYLDTGLFLDHRPMRDLVFKSSKGKQVLNLFSYTGTVSVMAALGGAAEVTSVDMSNTYQTWARRNFHLNNIDPKEHIFVTDNALEFLYREKGRYDLIFLDPPTFSNSKKMMRDFEVERDQEEIVGSCMKLLKPQGKLYFSTNKRKFKIIEALKQKFKIIDMTERTIPQDFRDRKIHDCFEITV